MKQCTVQRKTYQGDSHLVAAVLAEVGVAGQQGCAAGQAAQPHLGKFHDAARMRRRRAQRYAPRVRTCSQHLVASHAFDQIP